MHTGSVTQIEPCYNDRPSVGCRWRNQFYEDFLGCSVVILVEKQRRCGKSRGPLQGELLSYGIDFVLAVVAIWAIRGWVYEVVGTRFIVIIRTLRKSSAENKEQSEQA